MAFPLDRTTLLRHLRTTYLALDNDDNSGYTKRIIKQQPLDRNIPTLTTTTKGQLSESPPITFEISRHLQKTLGKNQSRIIRQKSKRKLLKHAPLPKIPIINTNETEPDSDNNNNGSSTERELSPIVEPDRELESDDSSTASIQKNNNFGLNYTKTRKNRPKSKSRIPIVKFFQSKDRTSDVDSDSDSETKKLAHIMVTSPGHDTESIDNAEITEPEVEEKINKRGRTNNKDNSDTITIDSDFGVPVNASGNVVHNYTGTILMSEDSEGGEEYADTTELDIQEEYDDDDVYDSDESGDFTYDSGFTDIDNDSMIDSSLMDSFNENGESVSFGNQGSSNISSFGGGPASNSKRSRKKKLRGMVGESFEQHTVPKDIGANEASMKLQVSTTMNSKSTLSMKKPVLQFEKVEPVRRTENTESNLSSLIQAKFKSPNVNPLHYFAFVDPNLDTNRSHRSSVDIFVPPNTIPVMKDLNINNTVSIFDCIGFILLSLYKLPEFNNITDLTYLNPNYWRLELVDEDGENYGSFGVLDRTRIFSTYNNPKELAICRITDGGEITKNDTISPLPTELKQSLHAFQRKRYSINQIMENEDDYDDDDDGQEQIELCINVVEYDDSIPEKVQFKVPHNYNMAQVLREFCISHGLITTRYRFRQMDPQTGRNRYLKDVEKASGLKSKTMELIRLENKLNSILDNTASVLDNNITPSEAPMITPMGADRLDENMNQLKLEPAAASKRPDIKQRRVESNSSSKAIKKAIKANKYLDDILLGNNPQLPTNINTVYFKWRVFKNNSRMKIKNFSEKNFIIDGDYIHLTPPDDFELRNPMDSVNDATTATTHFPHHLGHKSHSKQSSSKTYSFHVTQIAKLKRYTKPSNYFRIVVASSPMGDNAGGGGGGGKDASMKKFHLVAMSDDECKEIMEKLKWVLQVYNFSSVGI
ncbi:AVO1 [[Candida] subhashii]|uniref:AVO1 n=1 Tax=[Candida] subhashii TaxID=561895 RepID=A0A8J5QFL7_9ASCO|nr:AVO1 [[Candida] subhashii]KAG7660705.1 AVO1 [[Candida] subhashii]